MSAQHITPYGRPFDPLRVTQAAVKAWHNSLSGVSYSEFVLKMKAQGFFWLADEVISEEGV